MKVTITKEWIESVPLEDDMLDPAAGAFRFELWSVAEPDSDPESNQNNRISLSDRDFTRFIDLIENPKPPTQNLRELMAKYQRLKALYPQSNL